jgi:hypothetical protein
MAHDTTKEVRRAECPQDVLAWIPWYPDGGLTEREKGAIEAHAALCSECRAELDIVSGAPWAIDGIELPDADRLFDEITARIDSETRDERATVIPISRGRTLSSADMARIEQWVLDPESERAATASDDEATQEPGARARHEAVGAVAGMRSMGRRSRVVSPLWAAAAALVLLAIGGLFGTFLAQWQPGSTGGDYQLASVPAATEIQPKAPMLDVVFSDSASAREIWSGLRGLGVEIVSGPTSLGVYRLRLLPEAVEGRAPTNADAAAVAARLVAPESRLAIFAEPVP